MRYFFIAIVVFLIAWPAQAGDEDQADPRGSFSQKLSTSQKLSSTAKPAAGTAMDAVESLGGLPLGSDTGNDASLGEVYDAMHDLLDQAHEQKQDALEGAQTMKQQKLQADQQAIANKKEEIKKKKEAAKSQFTTPISAVTSASPSLSSNAASGPRQKGKPR